jgi:hypothetical protein
MTARVLGWVARRLWAPVAVGAATGVQYTADMYSTTGDPVWVRLRVLIAVCALFAGIVAAHTPRRSL